LLQALECARFALDDLVEKSPYNRDYLRRVLSGNKPVSRQLAFILTRLLGCSERFIYFGEGAAACDDASSRVREAAWPYAFCPHCGGLLPGIRREHNGPEGQAS